MVLQRIQSVYLLIAVILMVVFAFFPALTFQLGDREFVYGALEADDRMLCGHHHRLGHAGCYRHSGLCDW